ncbi:hypothetical protein PS2_001549 [Malus domestica]|uniref:Uncharacterized protein n=1 Tax=Malus domestica TaxID=3750 RepID=A0A498KSR1_MALDO|nr:uncharacterized protein LOC103437865 [Malus domestica]RXI08735.1 hypothetical protein DVH24_022879 [Malus domestica]
MVTENKHFSSKTVTKESSVANTSCRVYYGEAGAIPFMWESQPGTPKHKFSESSLPPLTPPPSYSTTLPSKKHIQQNPSSKAKFLGTIFPRLMKMVKAHNMLSPSPYPSLSSASSSSSASYSYSLSSSSSNSSSGLRTKKGRKNRCFSVSRMPLENNYEEDYYYDNHHRNSGSPTSALCSGGKRKGTISTNFHGIRGCYSVRKIKIACLSIVKP